jgi:hypothetical protein
MSNNISTESLINNHINSIITPINNLINITPSDPTSRSNISINNTIKIDYTDPALDYNNIYKTNAGFEIKDRNDGHFKKFYLEDNDFYIIPETYNSNNNLIETNDPIKIIRIDDMQNIFNNTDNIYSFGNINITENNILRFLTTDIESDTTLIGLRQNNGKIEFRNNNDIEWKLLGVGGNGASDIYDLQSFNLIKSNVKIYEYLKFDASGNIINSNLSINNDNNPILGGNLLTNNFDIIFSNNSNIKDETGNIALNIQTTSNSNSNYLQIKKDKTISGNEDILDLHANSYINNNVNMRISTKGNGDLEVDLNLKETDISQKGDFIIKANEISLSDINTFNMSSGSFIGSIDLLNLDLETYSEDINNPTTISMNTETIIFQIEDNNKRYYISLYDGLHGQKGNIIFETTASNSYVDLTFISNSSIPVTKNIGTGTGLGNKLIFTHSGQSAMLQYLNLGNHQRNRWQILNTGCLIE